MKKKYVAPKIVVKLVKMENSIAAGSANVNPLNEQNELTSEWEDGSDIQLENEWQ